MRVPTQILTPVLVVLFGAFATFAVTSQQASADERERHYQFETDATNVEVLLRDTVAVWESEVQTSVRFVEATYPTPTSEFRTFIASQQGGLPDGEIGALLLEVVDPDDFDDLTERERALGNPDFSVLSLGEVTNPALVITRTGKDYDVFGLPLIGMEISTTFAELAPNNPPQDGSLNVSILEISDVMDGAGAGGLLLSPEQVAEGFTDVAVFFLASVNDESGKPLGWFVRPVRIATMLDALDVESLGSLNVQLRVDNVDLPVARIPTDGLPVEEAAYMTNASSSISGSGWTIEIWAGDDYGTLGSPSRQGVTWVIGLIGTLFVGAVLWWRNRSRIRLSLAQFERDYANMVASTDALTGLLNRKGLLAAQDSLSNSHVRAAFFLDLDGFKKVNDDDGHDRGDEVLQSVAAALRSVFREGDLIARRGGDEFVVVVTGSVSESTLGRLGSDITAAVSTIDERVSCSVGIARQDAGEECDIAGLVARADTAMYFAKRAGGSRSMMSRGDGDGSAFEVGVE